jgi:hypothetical protein
MFDWLSGSDEAEQAAAQNRAALANYSGEAQRLYDDYRMRAVGALGEARTGALSELGTGLTGQLDAYNKSLAAVQGVGTGPLQEAVAAWQAGVGTAGRGVEGALAAGRGGVEAYAPLRQLGESYRPAVDQYMSALGLRGPQAAAGAREAFQTSPGYQFQVDEATRQALANASRLGIAQSGNTADALRARAQGFAGSEWQDYLNRLQGFVSPQLQAAQAAAQGTAGAYGTLGQFELGGVGAMTPYTQGLANAYSQLFQGRRGLAGDVSGQYANIANAYGTSGAQRAGVQTGYGQDVTNVFGNVTSGQAQSARDVVQGNIAANNQIAQAAQQDAANYWNLIGAGGKAATKSFFG